MLTARRSTAAIGSHLLPSGKGLTVAGAITAARRLVLRREGRRTVRRDALRELAEGDRGAGQAGVASGACRRCGVRRCLQTWTRPCGPDRSRTRATVPMHVLGWSFDTKQLGVSMRCAYFVDIRAQASLEGSRPIATLNWFRRPPTPL